MTVDSSCMIELERQLTAALEKLSAQYAQEQQRQTEHSARGYRPPVPERIDRYRGEVPNLAERPHCKSPLPERFLQ